MTTDFILLVLTGLSLQTSSIAASGWSYSETSSWSEHYPQCGGFFQSPVDIVTSQVQSASNLKEITLHSAKNTDSGSTYNVTNNGHSVQISFPDGQWKVSLDGTSEDRYCVKQLHFHWGNESDRGSEHTLNGKQFSLEAHLVTYDCHLFSTYDEASTAPYGHAVLGFWGQEQVGVSDEATLFNATGDLISLLKDAVQDTVLSMPSFDLSRILEFVDPASYFRYLGSLTTPGCTQNVIWTVFTQVVPVSSTQLNQFRNLKSTEGSKEEPIVNNYRPVQKVSYKESPQPRIIYRSHSTILVANTLIILACWLVRSLS